MIELITSVADKFWQYFELISLIVTISSILIKFIIPQLPEDHWAKPYVKFLGKLALNRTSDNKLKITINE